MSPVDVRLDVENTSLDPQTGQAGWNVTVGNDSNQPTQGPVVVLLTLPTGSRLVNDPCAGVGSGDTAWTCEVVPGGLRLTRTAGLKPGEVVTFQVVTVGGDLSNLVLGGSVAVDGDTIEGNNAASDSVGVGMLPATGSNGTATVTWIGSGLLVVGLGLLVVSRGRRRGVRSV